METSKLSTLAFAAFAGLIAAYLAFEGTGREALLAIAVLVQ